MGHLHRAVLCVTVVPIGMSACTTTGLAFKVDERLEIVAPTYREQISLPLVVDWSMDAGPSQDEGFFAVVVDGAPPPPGQGLDWLARGDDDCQRRPGCPDADWFRSRGIFATRDTRLIIDRLPPRREPSGRRDLHEVTIVLLDGQGRRIGEGAWTQVFELAGEGRTDG